MKQAIVVRKDLKMDCGKIAGQVAHASVRALWFLEIEYGEKKAQEMLDKWAEDGEVKIILKVRSEEEILQIKEKCESLGVHNALVHDTGKTQIKPNTLTTIGIGPDEDEKIDEITRGLKLL
jgi:PTH2 family peptidyl-tRNA hydrolase